MRKSFVSFLSSFFSLPLLFLLLLPLTAKAQKQQPREYNIVFIGNSITYGALHQNRERTAPPTQCAAWLCSQEGIDSIYFANCGRSGRTSYHFVPREEDIVPAGDKGYFSDVVSKARDLVKQHPGAPLVFSVKLGTNDAVERTKNHATTPDDYLRNLTLMADSLLALWPDAHIVLHRPIWNTANYTTVNGSVASSRSISLMSAYVSQFPKLVKRHPGHVHIGDTKAYDYFHSHWETDLVPELDALEHAFFLHPNEEGAKNLARYWGEALLPILRDIPSPYALVRDPFHGIMPVNDASRQKSLNGQWGFTIMHGVERQVAQPVLTAKWDVIPVPGCWEQYGYSKPKYSFPDSLTGFYITDFTVPAEWEGQRVAIRLDGVLHAYDLWVNKQHVGFWDLGYNTAVFDLTPYLTKGAFKGQTQSIALTVYSHTLGYEFDCFDDWAPMGIHRDVTLFAVPETHMSDLTVTTKMDGTVQVQAKVEGATRSTNIQAQLIDKEGRVVAKGQGEYNAPLSLQVPSPHLWTAETPYLYTLRLTLADGNKTLQTHTQKVGIREVSIQGNQLLVNGKPVKLRGVTCHSTDPKTVKVISDELTLKDMRLMKEASINYIRTSHYPREPRFFELADSLGFYVVCESPMGSRGEKNLSKAEYQDNMRRRARATIQRDKNHPCVIVWSIGNENPLPLSCQHLGEYAKTLDATRPICYPQKGSYFRSVGFEQFPKVADIYAPHYPTTGQLRDYYTKTDRPLIFTEYCHTLGISFEDHDRQWDIIEATPGIAGGSVWEWVDQGMPFSQPGGGSKWRTDGSEADQKVYTSMDGGFEMYGNQGTDGLLYADRTPLPNYYELQHNYARAFASDLTIQDGTPAWSVEADSTGNNPRLSEGGDIVLTLHNRFDFLDLRDAVNIKYSITHDRDTIATNYAKPYCPPHSTTPLRIKFPPLADGLNQLHLTFNDKDGNIFLRQSFVLSKPTVQLTGTAAPAKYVQEQRIRAGRKATMCERITQKGRLPERYLLPMQNDEVRAQVRAGQQISFTLTPDNADVFRAELGLAYLLAPGIDRVQWMGYGPYASYPGRHQANRYGLWAKQMDDLYFEGNHGGIDVAYFSDAQGNGIVISGDSLDLNFEQTDRGIVVTVNAAVSGQGPKFAKTAFPGWNPGDGPVSATFTILPVEAGKLPRSISRLFTPAAQVPTPFKPFMTQYDTYLLPWKNIAK